jgi:hypothetical protein
MGWKRKKKEREREEKAARENAEPFRNKRKRIQNLMNHWHQTHDKI